MIERWIRQIRVFDVESDATQYHAGDITFKIAVLSVKCPEDLISLMEDMSIYHMKYVMKFGHCTDIHCDSGTLRYLPIRWKACNGYIISKCLFKSLALNN